MIACYTVSWLHVLSSMLQGKMFKCCLLKLMLFLNWSGNCFLRMPRIKIQQRSQNLYCKHINGPTGEYWLKAFPALNNHSSRIDFIHRLKHWNHFVQIIQNHRQVDEFICRLKSQNHFVQQYKQNHRKATEDMSKTQESLNGDIILQDLSTESKVRTTLHRIINSTKGKYCSVAFI